jgi:hypothetical protein
MEERRRVRSPSSLFGIFCTPSFIITIASLILLNNKKSHSERTHFVPPLLLLKLK